MGIKMTGKTKVGKKFSWMKRGDAAQEALGDEEKRAEQRRAESQQMFRFRMKEEETCHITFLDGDLDKDGLLDVPMIYEHALWYGGRFRPFACTQEKEPCPLCELGTSNNYLVGFMTVIDHREFQGKRRVYENSPKIFAAKRTTLKLMQKLATKRKGLAGCTFEVSRTSDKDPAVGNMFEWEEPKRTLAEVAKLIESDAPVGPADYEKEISYYTADELIKMGVGKTAKSIGAEASGTTPDNIPF